jgi:hypothetical protein
MSEYLTFNETVDAFLATASPDDNFARWMLAIRDVSPDTAARLWKIAAIISDTRFGAYTDWKLEIAQQLLRAIPADTDINEFFNVTDYLIQAEILGEAKGWSIFESAGERECA